MHLKVASLLVFLSASAFPQAAGGLAAISGVVRDATGSSVPNAKVVVSNETNGVTRNLTTNEAGLFTAPALVPAAGYRVSLTAAGFAAYEAKDMVLSVGQNLDLNIRLSVEQANTQVEVTGTAPLVEDTKTDLSQVVDSRQIMELPINGRRVDSFVLLTPGVTDDGTFGLLTFRGVAGHNSFLIDGNDATEQFYNENAGRTRIASQISADAVEEFQVVSVNYSAEYGRAMGGVVNTVTKSGSNALHGTAYWFFRNRTLNARDPFAAFNPHEYRHQTGATIGGPIKKGKLFYLVNVDVTRRNFPMVDSLNVPAAVNAATQTFIGCGVASGGQPAATPAQCAAINQLLPRFYGLIPRTLAQELYFGKLDYHLSEHNSFSASLNYLHSVSPNGIQTGATSTSGSAINSNGDDAVRVRNGRFTWTAIPKSNFVNEFRWGWSTDRQGDTFDQSELGQGLGFLQVSINGATMGPANYLPRVEPSEQRFQFVDNASWTKGKHIVKFGADIASTEDYSYFISNYYGGYTYQTVNAFALDYSGNSTGAKNWQRYVQTFGQPVVDATIKDYGFYLEDQWRATPRLTVNAGLRYEYAQLPQPAIINRDYPQTGHIPTGNLNLGPRLGLAYRLDDNTVLRAGYGMFHARFIGSLIDNLYSGNGVFQTAITLNNTSAPQVAAGPVFPNVLAAAPTGASISASSIQFMDPHSRTPYSEQATFAVERQLGRDLALTASYIWSRGVQLMAVRDLNLPPLSSTNFTYSIVDANGSPTGSYTTPMYLGATRPDARYGAIYQDENGVNSYYNALAIQARKRFSHGFWADVSYTWAHEIDDGQSNGSGALFFNSANNWLYNGNYKADKGSGALDQRHRLAISWIWQPTITHRSGAFFKYVVNNWQLSSSTFMYSGRPTTLTVRVTDTPVTGMFSNFNLDGSGLNGRAPFLPIDSFYTPQRYKSDARISKIIPFGEKTRLLLNFEVFNISNSWAATGFTSSQAYSEAKGVITATPQNIGIPGSDGGFPDGTQARRAQVGARLVW
ncbi:MAG TPA: TonB-dependent receptor [Candidatus Acidoferrales bacterium]|nr:TonB-dependent receptor [Candidatus Acidoferrales bacterium]